mmetsp:Transcript_17778/g.26936  ORF Transcript_17778/g.26936 Transcript_17778/m.26936 type:complete len:316 (+) Transcript_17778:72-1019(+)|eukprot:CAMPEP_0194213516 /NCGR_PEP_ID=MMETSP0156-20130528/14184_1 /TAXON_ID=33649 /ORGANISM="Thalassionema nitzschioides, Strain L26-B" /LENGTH=315 /DNA_ID=CAMNT_0038941569 /DNA_START=66 /DNA_END=1013 /DNA_ORIENTATION=-
MNIISTLTFVILIHVSASFYFSPKCGARNQNQIADCTTSTLRSSVPLSWITSEHVDSLLPKNDAIAILKELATNDTLLDNSEKMVSKNWKSLEKRILEETRTVRELLGDETSDRLLRSVQKISDYDPEAVKAFLESDAISALLSKVLFDGIFEFFQNIDPLGKIVNQLPIIGPIRQQIISETKRNLDRTLGPSVQGFLKSYNRVATSQAVDFVLSPANRDVFNSANVKLVSSLVDRPINTLFPADMGERLVKDAYGYVRNANMEEIEKYVDLVYDLIGDKSIDNAVNMKLVLDASPTLQRTVDALWVRAVEASDG